LGKARKKGAVLSHTRKDSETDVVSETEEESEVDEACKVDGVRG
jgi:hypothetical protein